MSGGDAGGTCAAAVAEGFTGDGIDRIIGFVGPREQYIHRRHQHPAAMPFQRRPNLMPDLEGQCLMVDRWRGRQRHLSCAARAWAGWHEG